MSTIPIFNGIRIIPRESDFLNRKFGARGEIFYDKDADTLRLYSGTATSGIPLARADLQNVTNAAFSAKATAAGIGGGGGNTTVTVSDEVPESPEDGNLWLNTNNGVLYVYVDDGDSEQWIQPAVPVPTLATVATSGDYDDLTNTPTLASVATSGDYNDLINTPDLSALPTYATISYVNAEISAQQFNLSVAADDSTTRSISSGDAIRFIGAGGVTTTSDVDGTITITGGATTGDITFAGTTIDSSDSSSITITPAVVMQSDLTVENDLTVDNLVTSASLNVGDVVLQGTLTAGTATILNGLTTFYQTTEVINTKTGATGTVVHDFSTGAVWYHSSLAANFTANFTNVPTTDNRTISIALILIQGATPYTPTAVEIAGVAQTIKWLNASPPSGTANQVDVVSFTLIRSSATWTVVGNLSTFG